MKKVTTQRYREKLANNRYPSLWFKTAVVLSFEVQDPDLDAYLASEGDYNDMDPEQRAVLLEQNKQEALKELEEAINYGIETSGVAAQIESMN